MSINIIKENQLKPQVHTMNHQFNNYINHIYDIHQYSIDTGINLCID